VDATIKWKEDVCFEATSGSGHQILIDGAPDAGGNNAGMRPMEAVLIGMGACSAFDVVGILKKGRAELVTCEVDLSAKRDTNIPKVFTHIHMHYRVAGAKLRDSQVARAVDLSARKYCSATAMLEKTAEVTFDYEILTP
jgi:putative redox protein